MYRYFLWRKVARRLIGYLGSFSCYFLGFKNIGDSIEWLKCEECVQRWMYWDRCRSRVGNIGGSGEDKFVDGEDTWKSKDIG